MLLIFRSLFWACRKCFLAAEMSLQVLIGYYHLLYEYRGKIFYLFLYLFPSRFAFVDPRVDDWLLMNSMVPTVVLTLSYLAAVYFGMKYMKGFLFSQYKDKLSRAMF